MINKCIKNTVLLTLCSIFTVAGCSVSEDTSTNNSSIADVATAKKERENYDLVDLSKLPQGASLVGSDPKEITTAVFPPPDEEPQEGNFNRDVTVYTVASTFTTVIVTETGLLDDSVNGIRHRADFESSGANSKSWKMIWAGKQYKCQSGRGSQNWSSKLCS